MKFGLKPDVEKKIKDYIYALFATEFSKTAIKKFDSSIKLKLKDRGLENEKIEKFVLEQAESVLTNSQKFREDFSESLNSILDLIEAFPEKQEGKNKIKAKQTTEFADFKSIATKQCDKIVFYPKGKKPITFTNPMLIETITKSMALPSPEFERIKKAYPSYMGDEVDFMDMVDGMTDNLYSQSIVLLRDEVAQIFNSHKAAFINLVTYELLELVGIEPSEKTDKAKISYIQKKYSSLGNQK